MFRHLYSLLLHLALPFALLRLWLRSRRQPAYRDHLGERFGRTRIAGDRSTARVIWVHAVSVGEMRAAEPLVGQIRARWPEHRLVLTCMTPTGRDAANSLYGHHAEIAYAPYDLPRSVARFLDGLRPDFAILMETEIWPNLLHAAARRHIPVILANARLSERSANGYRRFRALAAPAFGALSAVAAQSEADARRIAQLGASRIEVCGNLKFDVTPDPTKIELGRRWRARLGTGPVWLAASTRDGEEALVLAAYAELGRNDLRLVIVPRHPQRVPEVAALIEAFGARWSRRSNGDPDPEIRIWLGDSMGEMPAYYGCADLALIGGSLRPFGSQNLIEACACGCPVLVGPSDFNFAQATADALAAGAARRVAADAGAIAAAVGRILADAADRQRMAEAALAFAAAHRGATGRTLAVIEAAAGLNARAVR